MYENNGYGGFGDTIVSQYAPGHNLRYQQRMNMFNIARNLFPFNSGPEAKTVKASDVIKAAREIEAYLNGENS